MYLMENLKKEFYLPEEKWAGVDEIIFGLDDYFLYDDKKINKVRMEAIKDAFKHHYSNNLFYQRYCKENNVKPEDIKNEKDIDKIPLLPDKFFKDYPSENPKDLYEWLYRVCSVDIGKFDFNGKSLQDFLTWAEEKLNGVVTHSSGTSGKFSFMFRDDLTTKRMFYSADKMLLFSIEKPRDNAQFVYPGPIKTHLTMGRWISEGTKIFNEKDRHFLTDRALTIDIVRIMSGQINGIGDKFKLILIKKAMQKGQLKLLNLLKEIEKERKQVYILTFPYQLNDLMNLMEEEGFYLNLTKDSVIITGGGWKIYENKKVSSEEFAKRIEEFFGIDINNYRDIYGMSEMNGLAIECEERYKHIPPWIYPLIIDENNEISNCGEGRFAFLDPASNSYPGFIITGDKLKVLESCPECGRSGFVIEGEVTRMKGEESKGCGNLMREIMAGEMR
ncbi:MAG: hypothetical protein H5T45_01285 [Thermoplasmatales archaeon]|nr:hypothetical protein [Thermoplasmatales archaeon]